MPKITVNNVSLYYEIYGTGQPIVFVAGFSGDHTAWQNIVAEYAKSYQVIVFDNRGIGESDCPDYPYTTDMMTDDVVGLARTLKLGAVHLVEHSFGGCIVQNIAYKYPELVKSIVIANSFAKANVRLRLYTEIRAELINANAPDSAVIKFVSMLCWSQLYLKQPGMIKKLVQEGFFPITITGYKHQANAMFNFDSTQWLNKIKVPCLIIGADDDMLATVEQAEYLKQNISGSEYYCFKNVGHVPHVEQPGFFNKLVLKFISQY